MCKYRKLPIEIEAFKWTAGVNQKEDPKWIIEAIEKGKVYFKNNGTPNVKLIIKALEGELEVSIGDYIIKGIKDEIYLCKPDIFEKTYERIDK